MLCISEIDRWILRTEETIVYTIRIVGEWFTVRGKIPIWKLRIITLTAIIT